MYEAEFDLAYPVTPGEWSIEVEAFGHKYQHNFTVMWFCEFTLAFYLL
jgi:hypothetical protein